MKNHFIYSWIFPLILIPHIALATEFSIVLKRSANQCFYEFIKEGVECEFEYQVVSGGKLDVDVLIETPRRDHLYKKIRQEYDQFKFNTTENGEYMICFNNQFSTFTEKTIFISFDAGKKNQIHEQIEHNDKEMTFMESTANEIHNYLENIIVIQTHYKLQAGYGRRFSDELNDRVQWWSIAQNFLIIIVTVTQVLVFRRLFKDPRSSRPTIVLAHQTETFYGY